MLGNNGTAALSLSLPGQVWLTDILQISDLIQDSTFTKTDWMATVKSAVKSTLGAGEVVGSALNGTRNARENDKPREFFQCH